MQKAASLAKNSKRVEYDHGLSYQDPTFDTVSRFIIKDIGTRTLPSNTASKSIVKDIGCRSNPRNKIKDNERSWL